MKNMIQMFDAILGVLYDRASNADIGEAAAYFDRRVLTSHSPATRATLAAFVQARGDVVASDREAAAYVYAFGYLAMPERLNQAFLERYS